MQGQHQGIQSTVEMRRLGNITSKRRVGYLLACGFVMYIVSDYLHEKKGNALYDLIKVIFSLTTRTLGN